MTAARTRLVRWARVKSAAVGISVVADVGRLGMAGTVPLAAPRPPSPMLSFAFASTTANASDRWNAWQTVCCHGCRFCPPRFFQPRRRRRAKNCGYLARETQGTDNARLLFGWLFDFLTALAEELWICRRGDYVAPMRRDRRPDPAAALSRAHSRLASLKPGQPSPASKNRTPAWSNAVWRRSRVELRGLVRSPPRCRKLPNCAAQWWRDFLQPLYELAPRTPYSAPPGRESACSRKGATTAVISLPVTTGTTSNVAPKPRH
jgi:hypothetical protein